MTVLNLTAIPESLIKTATTPNYTFASYIRGESSEFKQVETKISHQECTQISYIFESIDVAEFENRAENLRDLLLEKRTALSEQEIRSLKTIFNNSRQLIALNSKTYQLILVALASILEPLIENPAYSQDVESIVRILLKSPSISLRYAALDIIAAGLGIVPTADSLLEEAKILLKNEEPGYVLEYLESL